MKNYRGEIKMVLFNHYDEESTIKVGVRIAQLILVWIKNPRVKKVVALDDM